MIARRRGVVARVFQQRGEVLVRRAEQLADRGRAHRSLVGGAETHAVDHLPVAFQLVRFVAAGQRVVGGARAQREAELLGEVLAREHR